MQKRLGLAVCGLVGVFGLAVSTAEKPPDDYVKAMKDVAAGVQASNKAIQDQDFDAVSKNAAAMIDALAIVEKVLDRQV